MNDSIGIGDLAAILTTLGVTIYVLGLIGIAVPIRRTFTEDLSTAWYTVALIPRTVVAGQGVRIWVRWPLVLTLLLLCSTALALISYTASIYLIICILLSSSAYAGIVLGRAQLAPLPHVLEESAASYPLPTRVTLRILKGLEALLLPILKDDIDNRAELQRIRKQLKEYVMVVLLVLLTMPPGVFVVLAGVTAFFGSSSHTDNPYRLYVVYSFLPKEGNFLLGVLLLFVGGFLIGFLPAISASPPLPKVKVRITRQHMDATKALLNPLEGHLIAHSDGFWYLFDRNNELLSIPDAQVLEVRTFGKAHITPSEKEEAADRGSTS